MTVTDYEVIIKRAAVETLLELMNASMSEATRDNTKKFIDDFHKNNSKIIYYSVEYLLSLEKRKSLKSFSEQAIKSYDYNDNVVKQLVQKITYHCLIRNSFPVDMRQRINQKIFNNQLKDNTYFSLRNIVVE